MWSLNGRETVEQHCNRQEKLRREKVTASRNKLQMSTRDNLKNSASLQPLIWISNVDSSVHGHVARATKFPLFYFSNVFQFEIESWWCVIFEIQKYFFIWHQFDVIIFIVCRTEETNPMMNRQSVSSYLTYFVPLF